MKCVKWILRDIFLCTPPIKTRDKNVKLTYFNFIFSDMGCEIQVRKEISWKQRSWEVKRMNGPGDFTENVRFPSERKAHAAEMLLHYLPHSVEVDNGRFWQEWAVKLASWTYWWLILPFSDSAGAASWKYEKRGTPTQERRDVSHCSFSPCLYHIIWA